MEIIAFYYFIIPVWVVLLFFGTLLSTSRLVPFSFCHHISRLRDFAVSRIRDILHSYSAVLTSGSCCDASLSQL
ncbi:hypothetical protein GCK32_022647 [Trichostrongylus colubriformis]|uniref:Uncharacterized protein n=1 Tax=Trichostrongylus colubriformis TaxID=6319 RepID=A0AAN8EUB1_TRICO